KNSIRANLNFSSDDSMFDQYINNDTTEESYQYKTNNTPEIDIALEKLPDKRKPPNMIFFFFNVIAFITLKQDILSSDSYEENLQNEK
ncbi:12040_t:CDS:2, partial [Gigaspora rosea]